MADVEEEAVALLSELVGIDSVNPGLVAALGTGATFDAPYWMEGDLGGH
jgi:hypothetical protein